MNNKRIFYSLLFTVLLSAAAKGQNTDAATSSMTLAPTVIFSGRGSVVSGPPVVVKTPAAYWSTDPNFGFAMGLNGNESWVTTSVTVDGTLNRVSFSLSTPINGVSWAVGDCFQVQGLTAYGGYVAGLDGIDLAVADRSSKIGTSTVTVMVSGSPNSCQTGNLPGKPVSGTTNLTDSPVYAHHYSMFLAGNEVVFNRLVSSSKYCPNVGTLRLCNSSNSNSDKIYMLDPNTGNNFVALQRWTGSGGLSSWTQVGDPSYGAIAPGGLSTPALFDGNGNREITFNSDSGPVTDYLTVKNSNADDHTVIVEAAGSDDAISINLKPKGKGSILCDGSPCGVVGAGVTGLSSVGNLDQTAIPGGFGNVCKIAEAIILSTSPTNVCAWTLPAVAKTWSFTCSIGYELSAGRSPTFTIAMNASPAPANETGFANIYWTNTGRSRQRSISSTSAGTQNILTGEVVATGTTYQATVFGTIQASAASGAFAIQALIGGQSPAGTVTAGTTCTLN